MKLTDLLKTGIKNLWRRKLRTSLTLMSVAIGAASIIVMLSLGIGMSESFKQSLESMGSLTVIEVYSGGVSKDGETAELTDKTVAAFEEIPGVQAATPVDNQSAMIVSGKYIAHCNITGMIAEKMQYFDLEVEKGEILPEKPEDWVLMGANIPMYFYNPKSRNYNQEFDEEGNPVYPVDVMEDKLVMFINQWYDGTSMPKNTLGDKVKVSGVLRTYNNEQDYNIYMDLSALKKMKADQEKRQKAAGGGSSGGSVVVYGRGGSSSSQQNGYNRAQVKVKDLKQVKSVSETLQNLGYSTYSLSDQLNELNRISGILQAILGGIGAVALLVAAIGIANTMIMATYERTREIGIMKVIGARVADVKRLFLFEAAFIGLTGGFVGLLLSFTISLVLNNSGMSLSGIFGGGFYMPGGGAPKLSVIPLWLYLLGLIFSTIIGVLAGYFPARRASSRISALEAIKNE